MSDDMEKRLKAIEMAVHSQTVAMRYLAQDVRDLADVMKALSHQLLRGHDVTPIPPESEAEKLLDDVLKTFGAGRGPAAKTGQPRSPHTGNE